MDQVTAKKEFRERLSLALKSQRHCEIRDNPYLKDGIRRYSCGDDLRKEYVNVMMGVQSEGDHGPDQGHHDPAVDETEDLDLAIQTVMTRLGQMFDPAMIPVLHRLHDLLGKDGAENALMTIVGDLNLTDPITLKVELALFEKLLSKMVPDVFTRLTESGLMSSVSQIVADWLSHYLTNLSISLWKRFFDAYCFDGSHLWIRVVVALFKMHQSCSMTIDSMKLLQFVREIPDAVGDSILLIETTFQLPMPKLPQIETWRHAFGGELRSSPTAMLRSNAPP